MGCFKVAFFSVIFLFQAPQILDPLVFQKWDLQIADKETEPDPVCINLLLDTQLSDPTTRVNPESKFVFSETILRSRLLKLSVGGTKDSFMFQSFVKAAKVGCYIKRTSS